MERMVDVGLLDFFKQKGTLSTLQCGGRTKRTTIDHLLSLEATVRKAQANSEHVVSIFFDMEKAYDLTWRQGILMDIHEAGIERRMLKFIENFLKPRSFEVKVNELLSDTKVQTEGITHRSVVISPSFFTLKINKIVAELPNHNGLQISLYMDDILPPPNQKVVERNLQNNINIVENSAQKNCGKK